MNNYLRSIVLPIAFVAASGINNYAAIAASVNQQSIESNTQIQTHQIPDRQITIAQSFPTPQSLEDEQLMIQGIALCIGIEKKLSNSPNDYQLRRLYDSCLLLIQKKGMCEITKISGLNYDLAECYKDLAEFARQWGNRKS
jgi:hypothetical protein